VNNRNSEESLLIIFVLPDQQKLIGQCAGITQVSVNSVEYEILYDFIHSVNNQ